MDGRHSLVDTVGLGAGGPACALCGRSAGRDEGSIAMFNGGSLVGICGRCAAEYPSRFDGLLEVLLLSFASGPSAREAQRPPS